MSQGSKEITAVSLCLINWLKIIVLLTPHWAKWQIKPELFLAGLCFQQFTWCLVLLPDGKTFFIVAAKQKKTHITRKEEKKVPVPFNNHYMGIAERFLWEQKKWEVWKSRRVVSFQSLRINEPTSCSSMLGFHTAMKSSFLSSTKDVAHLFGMTAFLFFFFRIASDFSLCDFVVSKSVPGLLDRGYELMSRGSDSVTFVISSALRSCFIHHWCNR